MSTSASAHPLLAKRPAFAHGVNSRKRLASFLASDHEVAEADIVSGVHRSGRRGIRLGVAIMAHPPRRWSDLSLEGFLAAVHKADRTVKLDFKTPRAFELGLPLARAHGRPEATMINIDCVRGPGGDAPIFRTTDLVHARRAVPGALLSIGSTTRGRSGPYTEHHIISLLAAYEEVGGLATVAIRAESALADPKAIEPLVRAGIRLTLWNSAWFNPATPELRRVLRAAWPEAWLDLTS